MGEVIDGEQEHDGREPDVDREPDADHEYSLGWTVDGRFGNLAFGDEAEPSLRWTLTGEYGETDDREHDDGDREPEDAFWAPAE